MKERTQRKTFASIIAFKIKLRDDKYFFVENKSLETFSKQRI